MQTAPLQHASFESVSFRVTVTASPPVNTAGPPLTAPAPAAREGAFAACVRLHEASLRTRALWLTRNPADAMDLLQDTFERALVAKRQDIPEEKMRGWLLVIMHNQFLDRQRRSRTRHAHRVLAQQLAEASTTPAVLEAEDAPLWESVDPARVQACLPRLSPCLRGVFELYVEGLPYCEIASTLGIPMGTVATRLHRARRLLREMLQQPQPIRVAMTPPRHMRPDASPQRRAPGAGINRRANVLPG